MALRRRSLFSGSSFTHNSSVTAEAFFMTLANAGTQPIFYIQMGGGTYFSIKISGGLLAATVPHFQTARDPW